MRVGSRGDPTPLRSGVQSPMSSLDRRVADLRSWAILLAALAAGAASCRDRATDARATSAAAPPARPSDLRGVVVAVDTTGPESHVLVVDDSAAAAGVRPVRIDLLLVEPRPLMRVRVGCRVRVWYFGGELRESEPGQATAAPLVVETCPPR